MSKDWQAHWDIVTKKLLGVIDAFPPSASDDRETFKHYLEYNELGLAFDTLCDCLICLRVRPKEHVLEELSQLHALVGMQDDRIDQLRAL